MTGPIRVVLCEDHPVYRDGLRLTLGELEDVEVVGEAADGTAALRALADLRPDVALMDLQMGGMDGAEVTRRALLTDPALRVLVLTMHDDDGSLLAALRAGAHGYLLKGAGLDDIAEAVRTVARGDVLLTGRMGARLPTLLAGGVPRSLSVLTRREHEVVELLARGLDNGAIASRLHLSPKTVRNVVSVVFDKLGTRSRAETVALVRDAGLASTVPRPGRSAGPGAETPR